MLVWSYFDFMDLTKLNTCDKLTIYKHIHPGTNLVWAQFSLRNRFLTTRQRIGRPTGFVGELQSSQSGKTLHVTGNVTKWGKENKKGKQHF